VIISDDQENNNNTPENRPKNTPKKKLGLVRVAVILCSCLARKQIKESEGVWV